MSIFYDMFKKCKEHKQLAFLGNVPKFEVGQHSEDREDKVGNLSGLCRGVHTAKKLLPLSLERTSCLIFFFLVLLLLDQK